MYILSYFNSKCHYDSSDSLCSLCWFKSWGQHAKKSIKISQNVSVKLSLHHIISSISRLLIFCFFLIQDQGPYTDGEAVYTEEYVSAFGFPSLLFFCWSCKERPRREKNVLWKPHPSPSPLSPILQEGRRKLNSLITNPSLWTKRICIIPGAIESLHQTHGHITPQQNHQQFNFEVIFLFSLLNTQSVSLFVSQNALQVVWHGTSLLTLFSYHFYHWAVVCRVYINDYCVSDQWENR